MVDNDRETQKITSYTIDEISKFAKRDELPEDGLHVIDHLLWYRLRDIYNEFAAGLLSKADGAERKQKAISDWMNAWERHQRDAATVYRMADLWKTVEEAASMYRKDRTLQNADLVLLAIYGMECRVADTEDGNNCKPDSGTEGGAA